MSLTFKNTADNTIGKYTGTPGGVREDVASTELTPRPGEDLMVSAFVEVAADAPLGPYDIALEAETATIFKAVPLQLLISSAGASILLSPMSGPADDDIRLSGSGFTPDETLTVTFAGGSVTTVPETIRADNNGAFTALIIAPSMAAGIYPVTVTGSTSGTSIDRPFGLKPSSQDTFVLYASPLKVDIPKGGSGSITAKIEPVGNFHSAVTLSVSGLDAISGASYSFSPAATVTPSIATPTTTNLNVNVPEDATEGTYNLTITAVSGSITQIRKVVIKVMPPAGTPDFGISLAPNTVSVSPAASVNTTVTITSINDFDSEVSLAVTMNDPTITWPAVISYETSSVTPSATTGLGKQALAFTASADAQPGNWTFKVTGTSGTLAHSTAVMVICTPSGTTITPYASPRLDPTTVTASTPMGMTPPWGDKITINGLINDGSEASIITPSKLDVAPGTLASLPEGASDMLGRITNMESSAPVSGVEWNLGFPFDSDNLTAAGFEEENLKVAYLNPNTGAWTEVTTIVDTTNKIAYASPDHFSSWTLIATLTPPSPESEVVTVFSSGGGGGATGVTSVSQSITTSGRFVTDVTAESADGKVEVSIPKDTIGKNRVGQPLYNVYIKDKAAPSPPPAYSDIIGLVYDMGPDGATFNPPISLIFTYNKSKIPAGATEENLVIATWYNGKWVDLEGSTVDPDSNTVTAPVSHFSIFTIMAHTTPAAFEISAFDMSPAAINPGESVTISATITNTGDLAGSHEVTLMINQGVTAIEEVSLAGHASQQLTFTVKPQNAGSYAVDVNGISGTFFVKETSSQSSEVPPAPSETPEEPSEKQATPTEVPAETTVTESAITETPTVPPTAQPMPSAPPARPGLLGISLWLIIGIAAGIIVIGIGTWQLVARRRTS